MQEINPVSQGLLLFFSCAKLKKFAARLLFHAAGKWRCWLIFPDPMAESLSGVAKFVRGASRMVGAERRMALD